MISTSFLSATPLQSPELIIWSICIGINIALIGSFIIKKIQGNFISTLIEKNALTSDSAITLCQANCNSAFLKLFLKRSSTLLRIVSTEGEETDVEKIRFYIKEENLKKASSFSAGAGKWFMLPIFAIVSVVLAYVIILLLPYLTF